jgi:hypothetical protein
MEGINDLINAMYVPLMQGMLDRGSFVPPEVIGMLQNHIDALGDGYKVVHPKWQPGYIDPLGKSKGIVHSMAQALAMSHGYSADLRFIPQVREVDGNFHIMDDALILYAKQRVLHGRTTHVKPALEPIRLRIVRNDES